MQKLRLKSVWDKEAKAFSKNLFELRESDKDISGRVNITSKKGEGYVSKDMPFIAYKSKIDSDTEHALRNSRGQTFEAEIGLKADSFKLDGKDKPFLKLVINSAKFEGETKVSEPQNDSWDEESDSGIPF